jgi:hypothetical protein
MKLPPAPAPALPTTQSLFCYGTLVAPVVTQTLLRRLPVHCPAVLVHPPPLPALPSFLLSPVMLSGASSSGGGGDNDGDNDGGSYSLFRRHPVKSQVFPGLIQVRQNDVDTRNTTVTAAVVTATVTAAAPNTTDIHGMLYYDLSPTEMQVLDWYEGVVDGEYTRTDCHVLLVQQPPQEQQQEQQQQEQQQQQQQEAAVQVQEQEPVATQVYVWNHHADDRDTKLHLDRDWSYEHFRDNHLEWFLKQTVIPCREELDRLGM